MGFNVPLRSLHKKYERQSKNAGGGKDNRAGGGNGKNGGDTAQKEVGTHDGAVEDSLGMKPDAIPTSEMYCKH